MSTALEARLARTRNFCIIAHIDHGKSTLADRLIQMCGGLSEREMSDQVLDSMDLERERGITIKSQTVALEYQANDGETYFLNFIDTPGHVDFSYEVSRALAASDGAVLLIDASQSVEAQTVAHCYAAIEQDIEILPVLNKIDLSQADPDRVKKDIDSLIGISTEEVVEISAKTGVGIEALIELIIRRFPPPTIDSSSLFRALIIDSWFDRYVGVVSLVRVWGGTVTRRSRIISHQIGKENTIEELGVFTPRREPREQLNPGDVGYICAGIKDIHGAPVGDTIMLADQPTDPLPGFSRHQPQVYAGLYPTEADDYESLKNALDKLQLNDASLEYTAENSDALGFGFRCGFLGLLHMEIIQERLEREYDLDLVVTAPSVVYEVVRLDDSTTFIHSPSELDQIHDVAEIREPIAAVNILVPREYIGNVLKLCVERRGRQQNMQITRTQVSLYYDIPLSEVVVDFFDRLKSASRGYASMDYSVSRFQAAPLVRLDILINNDAVDSLAVIVHKDVAMSRGRLVTSTLKDVIPRQMFEVAIQAAIGRKVIARTTVKALRKNVTAKCYGGDVTRKKKLLEKQKAGKRRMKQVGKVEIPQAAFMAALTADRQSN